ncbi:WD40-repeat-containing domain protein, partial [Baffinella frigidus]
MGRVTKLTKEGEVVLTGHSKPVQALSWSADGQKLATASSDTTARIWTVDAHREGKELQLKEHSDSVDGVAWNPTHNDIIATASADKSIRIWDIRARKSQVIPMGDEVLNVVFSPDGNFMISSDKTETLRVVDVRNNKNKVVAEACFDGQYWVNELVVNSNSDVVLMCAGRQGNMQEKGVVEILKIFHNGDKIELKPVHKIISHSANCTAIAIDSESKHFATGAYDGTACIWDAAELVCLRPCCTSLEEGIQNLGFSYDGSLIA